MIFYFIFPTLQVVFTCVIFGRTVKHLPVTVPADDKMSQNNFGSIFLNSFLNQEIFTLVYSPNLEVAVDQVSQGQAWATIVPWIVKGRSASHHQRMETNLNITEHNNNTTSSQSTQLSIMNCGGVNPYGIKLFLDQSNYVITQTMFYSFIQSMRQFLRSDNSRTIISSIESKTNNCPDTFKKQSTVVIDWNKSTIDIDEVIYGSTEFRFLEFLLPGKGI